MINLESEKLLNYIIHVVFQKFEFYDTKYFSEVNWSSHDQILHILR